jgi:hypothetical protein
VRVRNEELLLIEMSFAKIFPNLDEVTTFSNLVTLFSNKPDLL